MKPMVAAKGIEYWLRFHQVIGKSDLLNEDSIKYPLVEYLIADGDDSIKNIKLEGDHPVFSTREVDLISKDSIGNINYCIEFKLASKFTMKLHERQRILDDIMRLYFVNLEKNTDSYLIVAGKSIDFLSEFRSVIDKQPGQRGRPKKKTKDVKKVLGLINPYGFFSERWLSFDMETPQKIIDIQNEAMDVYKKHYEHFDKNYIQVEESSLIMPERITTTLEYITEIKESDTTGNVPAMVGIWKISSTSDDK